MLSQTAFHREDARVRLEEVIGHRMRERREELHLTQEQAGQRMDALLGRPWPRQAVSAAEKGDRAFTAAELVTIAFALDTSVSWLLTPLAASFAVQMPSGTVVDGTKLIAAVLPRPRDDEDSIDDMRETLVRLAGRVMDGGRWLDSLMDEVRVLHAELMQRADLPYQINKVGQERETFLRRTQDGPPE